MLPYILPFAIYILLSLAGGYFEYGAFIMYPIKTIAVAACLYYYRNVYIELKASYKIQELFIAVGIGIMVFVIWILPEVLYPVLGSSSFNPYEISNPMLIYISIAFRIAGAVIVVPVFEELFWRSFLIRWIINQDFKNVQIGIYTLQSFIITVLFFGIEHHRWLVGIVAGIIYNLLLYKYKNIRLCIVSHAVTNLCLAIYVLMSGQWSFW
jgi:hypothetical protein